MGAHTRVSGRHARVSGRHRGEPAPLFDVNLAKVGTTAGVLVAATGTAVALAPAAGAAVSSPRTATVRTASADDFAQLRQCESGGRYATNTGNGYYGAYQFDLRTWRGLGYGGLPSDAAPAVQDAAAETLQAERGWSPWPACSARLGLSSHVATTGTAYNPFAVRITPAATPAAQVVDAVATTSAQPTTPPAFDPTGLPDAAFNATLVDTKRADVSVWQQRMKDRGWSIEVDGYFGPKSAQTAAAFAREKGIKSGVLGAVDATMWNAAWQLPVT